MFNKIDFSDLYKFVSSIGLLLIITSFIVPIFILQVDLTKNHIFLLNKKDGSPVLIKALEFQENLMLFATKYWFVLSIALIIMGLLLLSWGLYNWNKQQKILDKLQHVTLKEKESQIEKANLGEINKKIEIDIEDSNTNTQSRNLLINGYKSVEHEVIKAISINNNSIKINHNAKVGTFVYDIIIIKQISQIKHIHKVCEIKFYQKEIFYSYIHHGMSSFLLAIFNYIQNIIVDDNRIIAEFYLIWICTDISQLKRLQSYIPRAKRYAEEKGIELNIIAILQKDINSLKTKLL